MKITNNQKINIALALGAIGTVLSVFLIASGAHKQPEATGPDAFYLAQAKEYGIRKNTFNTCFESEEVANRVQEEVAEAGRLGGQGTPFNVIQTEDGTLVSLPGAYPFEAFADILTRATSGDLRQDEIDAVPQGADIRPFDAERDFFKGDANAPITIFEYSDFECPFCARVHPELEKVVAEFPNVKWVYRHLPLDFHPQAEPAARASICIGQEAGNEAFWNFADAVFADPEVLKG